MGRIASVGEVGDDTQRTSAALPTLGSTHGADESPRPSSDGLLDRGTALGRYVILDRIGSGAMGMVYAAFDPALDRKIALKVLRAGREVSEEARDRLVREARAMARLDHPNVVTVHDVGTVGTRVFVAMEFVAGTTLREWLKTSQRPWRQIVEAFTQAGEGLAAAHEAGLVHRDFKPDNVMVSELGGGAVRVRVMDFGLAHVPLEPGDDLASTAEVPAVSAPDDATTRSLTRTGAILGTPAYMAPEQFARSQATASSDQFAFCVALHEALYGRPPFLGDTLASLAVAVATGSRRPTPAIRLPRALISALDRGLSVDVAQRWPNMRELLANLRTTTATRRWSAYALGGAIVTATIVGVAASNPEPPCRESSAALGGFWNDAHRGELATSLRATGVPFAEQSWTLLQERVDGWTTAWLHGRKDACEATHVRHEQSEAMLDRRVACLDRQLEEARGVLEVVAAGTADDVEHLPEVMRVLADPEACSDTVALAAAVPLPSDPATREAIAEIEGRLGRLTATQLLGHTPSLLVEIEQLVADAKAVDYAPVLVEAYSIYVRTLDNLDRDSLAADAAIDAVWAAHAAGDARSEAKAVALVVMMLAEARRTDEVPGWLRHLEASVARFPGDDGLAIVKLDAEASVAFVNERLDDARASYTAALNRCEAVRTSLDCLRHLARLADVELRAGQLAVALGHFERVREARVGALGPDHPLVAASLNDIGMTLRALGRLPEARERFDEASRIFIAIDPKHHGLTRVLNNRATVALFQDQFADAERDYRAVYEQLAATAEVDNYVLPGIRGNIAMTVFAQGRFEEALVMHTEVLDALIALYSEQNLEVADAIANIGEVQAEMKRWDEARASFERARRLRETLAGSEHIAVARADCSLGEVALAQGRNDDAIAAFEGCRVGFVRTFGAEDAQVASPERGLGETMIAMGRTGDGIAMLEHARALLRNTGAAPRELALVEWPLGRAQWQRGTDRPAARAMIEAAEAAFAKVGGLYADDAAACRGWLRAHPR